MKLLLFAPLAQAAEACACAEGLASIKLELAVLRKQHVAELSELRALLVEMAASSSATAILEPMGHDISPVASTATPSGRTLEQWVERAAASPLDSCATAFPSLRDGDSFHYGGCNRNVHRNTTISVETCQTGNVTLYNTSTVASNGLFDIAIAANTPTHDVWHFVCGLAHDDPHRATCTLTFETAARPEGPAWLRIYFEKVAAAAAGAACRAQEATLVGTYFFDAFTNDAGVYVFHANATG